MSLGIGLDTGKIPEHLQRKLKKRRKPRARRPRTVYLLGVTMRRPDGGYHHEPTAWVKEFATAEERLAFWRRIIEPRTGTQPGARYAFSMADARAGEWRYVGQYRYGPKPILSGERWSGTHVVYC